MAGLEHLPRALSLGTRCGTGPKGLMQNYISTVRATRSRALRLKASPSQSPELRALKGLRPGGPKRPLEGARALARFRGHDRPRPPLGLTPPVSSTS
eukprot:4143319-Pyramimonas_sp.AAC.1